MIYHKTGLNTLALIYSLALGRINYSEMYFNFHGLNQQSYDLGASDETLWTQPEQTARKLIK